MEKEKILIKIQKEAGTIPLDSVCSSCASFIAISDALSIFPNCKTTQQDLRDILDSRVPNNCKQNNNELLNRCQGRRNLIEKFLDLCEEDQKNNGQLIFDKYI